MEQKMDVTQVTISPPVPSDNTKTNVLKGLFLIGVASCAGLAGCVSTIQSLQKSETIEPIEKTVTEQALDVAVRRHQEAVKLGSRALAWGTIYAFAGCGLLVLTIWKLSGAHNMTEFRYKMGSILPRITKEGSHKGQGRTDFENVSEFLAYLDNDSTK